jgi:t-SNARE complex subunit (syntaxin)
MSGWLDAEKKRSAYADSKKSEIDELSNLMYQLISSINRIESFSKDINTPKDTETLRTKLRKLREKAKKEENLLNIRLENAKVQALKDDTHDEKQFGKLKKQAKEIVDRFHNVIRESQEKEKNSTRGGSSSETNDGKSSPAHGVEDTNETIGNAGTHKQKFQVEVDESRLVLSEFNRNVIETEKALAKEQLRDLQHLEVDMNDLQECFVHLNVLIREQQSSLDQIESNLDQANVNMEEGIEDIKWSNENRIGFFTLQNLAKKMGPLGMVAGASKCIIS